MSSNTSLSDLLAEMRDLDAVDREVEALRHGDEVDYDAVNRIATRPKLLGEPGAGVLVVPRGYFGLGLTEEQVAAAWEAHMGSDEFLAQAREWSAGHEHLFADLPPREPPPTNDEPAPRPDPVPDESEGPRLFKRARRMFRR